MEISQELLGLLFSLSVATGVGAGIVWSLLRLLRGLCGTGGRGWRSLPVRVLLTGADILFGVLSGISVILLLYYVNDGQFRLLAVLGVGCGFFAWYHTLGALLGKVTDWLSDRMRAALRRMLGPVVQGIRRLVGRIVDRCRRLALGRGDRETQESSRDETAGDE